MQVVTPSEDAKLRALTRHVVDLYKFEFSLICKSDIFVSLRQLETLTGEAMRRLPEHAWSFGPNNYLLSAALVAELAHQPPLLPENGSGWFRRTLEELRVELVDVETLYLKATFSGTCIAPIIAVPDRSLEVMEEFQSAFESAHVQSIAYFEARHEKWKGTISLLSNGIFLGGCLKPHGRWILDEDGRVLSLKWFDWRPDHLNRTDWGYTSKALRLVPRNIVLKAFGNKTIAAAPETFRKVQFGCGVNRLSGWKNFDRDMDIRRPLPIPDQCVHLVFAEHVIEHLCPREVWDFFKEVRRILVDGGGVRFIVPCVDLIYRRHDDGYRDFIRSRVKGNGSVEEAMQSIICNWGHQTIWTVEGMRALLGALGFETWESEVGSSRFSEAEGIDGHAKQIGKHPNWVESGVVEGVKLKLR